MTEKSRTAVVGGAVLLVLWWMRRARKAKAASELSDLSRRWSETSLASVLKSLPISPKPSTESPPLPPRIEVGEAEGGQPAEESCSDENCDGPTEEPVAESPWARLSKRWSATSLTALLQSLPLWDTDPEPTTEPRESLGMVRASPASHGAVAGCGFTFCEFMEASLHDPSWGYYAEGRVRFGEQASADFTTFPVSMRPHFGAMLADRFCSLWRSCTDTRAPFILAELGAGTGVLAHAILSRLSAAHPEFYSRVIYLIGERSSALRAVQATTNAAFIEQGRLVIEEADARSLGHLRDLLLQLRMRCGSDGASILRGAVLSNELPDAFGVEKVLLGLDLEHGRLRMQRARVLPLIRRSALLRIEGEIAEIAGGDACDASPLASVEEGSRRAAAQLAQVIGDRVEVGICGLQITPPSEIAISEWLRGAAVGGKAGGAVWAEDEGEAGGEVGGGRRGAHLVPVPIKRPHPKLRSLADAGSIQLAGVHLARRRVCAAGVCDEGEGRAGQRKPAQEDVELVRASHGRCVGDSVVACAEIIDDREGG